MAGCTQIRVHYFSISDLSLVFDGIYFSVALENSVKPLVFSKIGVTEFEVSHLQSQTIEGGSFSDIYTMVSTRSVSMWVTFVQSICLMTLLFLL